MLTPLDMLHEEELFRNYMHSINAERFAWIYDNSARNSPGGFGKAHSYSKQKYPISLERDEVVLSLLKAQAGTSKDSLYTVGPAVHANWNRNVPLASRVLYILQQGRIWIIHWLE